MKTIILAEMFILWAGDIVQSVASGQTMGDLAVDRLPKLSLAVVILLGILLTMDDLGQGKLAAIFGLLLTISYLLAIAGKLGATLQEFTSRYLSRASQKGQYKL